MFVIFFVFISQPIPAQEISQKQTFFEVYRFIATSHGVYDFDYQYVMINNEIIKSIKRVTRDIIIIKADEESIKKYKNEEEIKLLIKDIKEPEKLPPITFLTKKLITEEQYSILEGFAQLRTTKEADKFIYFLNQLNKSAYKEEFYNCFRAKNKFSPYGRTFANYVKLFFILKNNDSIADNDIKNFLYENPIVKINDKYFDNLSKIDIDKIDKTSKIEVYDKKVFKKIKKLKKYEKLKDTIGVDALGELEKYVEDPYFIPTKQNYKIYEIIKDKDYISKKDKQKIISSNNEKPCVTLNPKYYPKKITKVKRVINSSKTKDEDKTKEINSRIKMRLANPIEILRDVQGRIYVGVGYALVPVFWPIALYYFVAQGEQMIIDYCLW